MAVGLCLLTRDHRADAEVEHRVERGRVSPQAASERRTFPTIDQKVRHLAHVTVRWNLASLARLVEAGRHAFGD